MCKERCTVLIFWFLLLLYVFFLFLTKVYLNLETLFWLRNLGKNARWRKANSKNIWEHYARSNLKTLISGAVTVNILFALCEVLKLLSMKEWWNFKETIELRWLNFVMCYMTPFLRDNQEKPHNNRANRTATGADTEDQTCPVWGLLPGKGRLSIKMLIHHRTDQEIDET